MKQKIYKSENYFYVFEIDIKKDEIEKFAQQAEDRRKKILSVLGISENICLKKAMYIISNVQSSSLVYGKSNSQSIVICVSDKERDLLSPHNNMLIHEETHFLLLNIWPEISSFINEGIAEYICWKTKNLPIPNAFYKNKDCFKNLSENMILKQKNWMKLYVARGIPIYGLACIFIEQITESITIKKLLDEIYIYRNISKVTNTLKKMKNGGLL